MWKLSKELNLNIVCIWVTIICGMDGKSKGLKCAIRWRRLDSIKNNNNNNNAWNKLATLHCMAFIWYLKFVLRNIVLKIRETTLKVHTGSFPFWRPHHSVVYEDLSNCQKKSINLRLETSYNFSFCLVRVLIWKTQVHVDLPDLV